MKSYTSVENVRTKVSSAWMRSVIGSMGISPDDAVVQKGRSGWPPEHI